MRTRRDLVDLPFLGPILDSWKTKRTHAKFALSNLYDETLSQAARARLNNDQTALFVDQKYTLEVTKVVGLTAGDFSSTRQGINSLPALCLEM